MILNDKLMEVKNKSKRALKYDGVHISYGNNKI